LEGKAVGFYPKARKYEKSAYQVITLVVGNHGKVRKRVHRWLKTTGW
jgi:hypothetical protein